MTLPLSVINPGHPKAIYQKAIHLEDLLELQHLRDPVSIVIIIPYAKLMFRH